jgi:hypothetical protein
MKEWRRARLGTSWKCGSCGTRLITGAALQVWTLPGVRRQLIYCEACVGPAPADLAPLVVSVPEPAWRPLVPIRSGVGLLPLDWKARSAGDREPGEDDQ